MDELEDSFSAFDRKNKRKSSFGLKFIFKCIFWFVIAALLPTAYVGWKKFYSSYLEIEKPQLTVYNRDKLKSSLSDETEVLKMTVLDEGAGLGSVRVVALEEDRNHVLFEKSYQKLQKEDMIEFEFSPAKLGIAAGMVEIVVDIQDRSRWKNQNITPIHRYTVDYQAPVIEIISKPKVLEPGEPGLLIYRLDEKHPKTSGVMIGGERYNGYSIRFLKNDFAKSKGIYFLFFALPLSETSRTHRISLVAEDVAENVASKSFQVRTLASSEEVKNVDVEEDFGLFTGSDVARVRTTLSEVRMNNRAGKAWVREFLKHSGEIDSSNINKIKKYYHLRSLYGSLPLEGLEIDLTGLSKLVSVAPGVVRFARVLDLYNYTIIVDHGFGLYSTYANLADKKVYEGDSVERGQVIGEISRENSYFQRNFLYFEFHLNGHPIDPSYLWDSYKYKTRIQKQLDKAVKYLDRIL